jgi:Fic family protein
VGYDEAARRMPLTLDAETAGVVSEAENAIRALNATVHPVLAPLARLRLRTESIASSKVEGMQLGVRELARAEARAETGGKASPTAMDILANIDAMQVAVDQAATVERFTVDEIIVVHRRLLERAQNAHIAGRIRTQQSWIGGNDHNPCGADFVLPPPGDVGALLSDLCAAINSEVLPPLVQAALVHAQFETIHPFDDGNGRTGRALIQVVLRRRRIAPAYVPPISVVLAAARDRYIEGLTGFRDDRVGEWAEQFAAAAARAAHLAKAYIGAVQELTARWRVQLGAASAPRSDAAAWALLQILPAHPIITAPAAAAATRRAKAAIYQALRELEDAGVIAPLSESRRNQSWEAVGLLDLLASRVRSASSDGGRVSQLRKCCSLRPSAAYARTSFLYAIRWGRSASVPFRLWKSSLYSR